MAKECAKEICKAVQYLILRRPYYLAAGEIFEDRSHLARAIRVTKVPYRRSVSEEDGIPTCQGALPADIEFSRRIKVAACQGLESSLAQILGQRLSAESDI